MATNTYETVFITEPEIAPEAVDTLVNKIKDTVAANEGAITHEDRWGRRRMSYAIQGHRDGFYVILDYTATAGIVAALDHLFRVTDSVIRHMTVRVIKKNKTFPPRRAKPAGYDSSRPSGPRSSRPAPVVTPPPSVAAAQAAAAAPAAPATETPGASA